MSFNHLDNIDFETSLVNLQNNLTQRDCDRLGNLILNPFQINNDTQDNLFNPDTILFDKGVIESRYYIANEFTNLTGHN